MRANGAPEEMVRQLCNERDDFPVWPENWQAVRVWCAVAATQWQVLPAGALQGRPTPLGLRYETLPAVMDLLAVPAEERADAFAGLRTMEHVVLQAWRAERRG